jgi:hypothetical protein
MRKIPNSTAPKLESLEAREVPAVHIFEVNHTLHVVGDGHADTIAITDNGKGTITVNAGTEHFTATDIHHIKIDTGGGGDTLTYDLTAKLTTTETITAWLGKGSDKATFNFSAGVGSDGHLTLRLHDGAGADRDSVTMGSVAKGGSAVVKEFGGRGNDRISFHASGEVGGRLAVTVRGGWGHDIEHIVTDVYTVGTGKVTVSSS